MTTWEIEPSTPAPRPDSALRAWCERSSLRDSWTAFNDRRGTAGQSFAQRLARARLLYLRRAENGANWLALAIVVAAVSLPSFFPRDTSHLTEPNGLHALPAGDTFTSAANLATHLESTAGQVNHV